MILFPPLKPTSREFIAGAYPIAAPEFQSSVRYARLTGTQAVNPKLSLEFINILDDQAAAILECYSKTLGGFTAVTLPDEVVSGTLSRLLADRMQGTDGVRWHFEEAPQQESVFPGISTVRVRLKGVLVE